MSKDRTARDVMDEMDTSPKPGRASEVLDAERMVREGQDQARRQQEDVDRLNNR